MIISNNVLSFLSNTLRISNEDMQLLVDAIDKNHWDESMWRKDECVQSILSKIQPDICPMLIYRGIIKLMDR